MQRLSFAMVAVALLFSGMMAAGFEPPNEQQRLAAIGPTNGLSAAMQRALDPSEDFRPIPAPGPHDWLVNHEKAGLTEEAEWTAQRLKRIQDRAR